MISTYPFTKSRTFLVVLTLALVLMGFTTHSSQAAPAAQEASQVELRELLANPSQYEDQIVSVSGEVADVGLGENMFVLRADDVLLLDQILVLGSAGLVEGLEGGLPVLVTGSVQTFTTDLPQQLGFDVGGQVENILVGRTVLVAETVEPQEAAELAEDVVVRIGDRTITQGEFDEWFFNMMNVVAARRGIPLNEQTIQIFEGLRREFLSQMVTEQVLLEEAARRGIQVGEEDVQIEMDRIRDQFETTEAYMEALQRAGFETEDAFREFLRNSQVIQYTIEAIADESPVTDQEVREFYEMNPYLFRGERGMTIPFEQVEPQIRRLLERQRFAERVRELQEGADIEILFENLQPVPGFDLGQAGVDTGAVEAGTEITETMELTGTGVAESGLEVRTATAELLNLVGEVVGTAEFSQLGEGPVEIQVELMPDANVPPGLRGIHIHAIGQCEPTFEAAGGHFNPTGAEHGLDNPNGPHAGDLPNIAVAAGETTLYEATNDRITLGEGEHSLFDADGSALIIHAGLDDQITDPAGNSGSRVVCGVIRRNQ